MIKERQYKLLLVDNHDSFVYNIVGLLERVRTIHSDLHFTWDVILNDQISIGDVASYDALILSPGPGIPSEAGKLMEIISVYANKLPILGICLGFQAIAESFGAHLVHLPVTRHGHPSRLIGIDPADPLLGKLATTSPTVGRYHSWGIAPTSLPDTLIATSFDEEGNLMSIRHRDLPLFGTQFHPESIISDCGLHILASYLKLVSSR